MREIQIRWGRRNLGFAWLFAEPLVFAFPVLLMWSMMRSPERDLDLHHAYRQSHWGRLVTSR